MGLAVFITAALRASAAPEAAPTAAARPTSERKASPSPFD